jgi:hypothetical protein
MFGEELLHRPGKEVLMFLNPQAPTNLVVSQLKPGEFMT